MPRLDGQPIPAKQRGWFFDGTNSYEIGDILHHSGSVSSFIRVTDMSILNTLYSRHTTSTGTDGDEDFVDFIINLDGSLNFMLKDKQGETVALNSPKNSINLGRWYFVAASWAWDGASTSFSLQINNSSPVNRTGGTNVVAEDSTTNTAFLAKGVDIIDGV